MVYLIFINWKSEFELYSVNLVNFPTKPKQLQRFNFFGINLESRKNYAEENGYITCKRDEFCADLSIWLFLLMEFFWSFLSLQNLYLFNAMRYTPT